MSRQKRASAGTKALIPQNSDERQKSTLFPFVVAKTDDWKKKKKHRLEVENYVLFNGFLNTTAQDKASQIVLRNYSKGIKEEPGNIRFFFFFCWKKKKSM